MHTGCLGRPLDDPFQETLRQAVSRALRVIAAGDADVGVAIISALLVPGRPPEDEIEILFHRAFLFERLGSLEAACADLASAYALTQPATEKRYAAELTLAYNARARGDLAGEVSWLRAALHTAASNPDIDNVEVVKSFLALVGEEALSEADRAALRRIESFSVRRSP